MANQRRSIWELRFYAVQEMIRSERKYLRNRLANMALKLEDHGLDEDIEIDNIKIQLEQIEKFDNRIREIETKNNTVIFLLRDH